MPKIYRVMLAEDGKPAVGADRNRLGARPGEDLPVDAAGKVSPNTGGVSVNGCPCTIPPTVAPRRLRGVIPGAKNTTDGRILWSCGQGPFLESPVSPALTLRPRDAEELADRQKGYVEPGASATFGEYQQAIASTQGDWNEDEQRNSGCPVCGQPS